MPALNRTLNFGVLVFFITNLWILTFTKLVAFLNLRFPPTNQKNFLWVQYAPEPFEIPIFLILSGLTVLLIFLAGKFIKIKFKLSNRIKFIFFTLLLFLFVVNLGSYPLAGQIDPYTARANSSIYLIIPLLYLLIFGLLIFLSQYLNRFLLAGLLFVLLGLITFDAGFPITGHDYEYFIGPSYEVSQGKTVYTDILSRYSFLAINLFALLHKLNILDLFYIPAIIWSLYVIQYFSCFVLLYKISNSKALAVLGTLSILTLNYFSLAHLPSVIPQVGPLRWLPLVFLLVLLQKVKKIDSLRLILPLSILSFLMIDAGVAMILAYTSTLVLLLLKKELRPIQLIKAVLILLISLISTLLVINLLHLLLGLKPVDILTPFYSFRKHAVYGLSLMPMANKTYFWLVPLIYFASIIYFFQNRWRSNKILSGGRGERDPDDAQRGPIPQRASAGMKPLTESDKINSTLLLFSANISLFAGIYFVGRSHPHNLFNIAIFPLLNLFLLLGIEFRKVISKQKKLLLLLAAFVLLIVVPVFQRRLTLTEMLVDKYTRLTKGNIFQSEAPEIIKSQYKEEITLIKTNLPEETLILSSDDTYLFYATGKKNLLDANPILGIDLPEDLNFAVKKAVRTCPKRIAIDCSYVGKCAPYTPFVGVKFNLNLILDKLQTACKVHYTPATCTAKICSLTTN